MADKIENSDIFKTPEKEVPRFDASANTWNKKCVVPFCRTVANQGFSVFPKDAVRKQAWMDIFGLVNVSPDARVCHGHFSESNYSVPKPNSLRKRRRLNFHALPDLELPESKLPKLDHFITVHDAQKTVGSEGVEQVIGQAAPKPTVPLEFVDCDHDYPGSSFMSRSLSEMDAIIMLLRNEIKKLRNELRIANMKLRRYQAKNLPQTEVKKVVHEALSHSTLGKGQINWLLSKKKRFRSKEWTNKEYDRVGISLSLLVTYLPRFQTI